MTFQEWISQPTTPGQRRGQHLFNTAPEHITNFARGDLLLDPFNATDDKTNHHYAESNRRIERFTTFAYLVWDTTDQEDLKTVRLMIWRDF